MKWLMLLAMAATAMGADETNRFSFTNRAGQVFTDAKLIKVENGEAVVIAGTVGARVKIEELPLEVQTMLAFRETEGAAKLRGVHTTTNSKKGTRDDYVIFRGNTDQAMVFSIFERKLFAGESTFLVDFIVHLKGPELLDGKFDLWMAGGSISCNGDATTAEVSKPGKGEEGFPYEAFLTATVSKDEMVRLIATDHVTLRFESSEGERRIRLDPSDPLDGFKELCLGAKERRVVNGSDAGPAPSAGISAGATMRVTEMNDSWWRYAYRVQVNNQTSDGLVKTVKVQFLDAGGFVVDEDRQYNVAVPAGEAKVVTGFSLIRLPAAKTVKRIQAQFTR